MQWTFLKVLLLCFPVIAVANNIQVSNVSLIDQNAADNTYQVKFDIAWQNSWRTSTFESNWDAVWIFVKYREIPNLIWSHAVLQFDGSVAPAGSTLDLAGDTGAMLYRDSEGIGDVSYQDIELTWFYGGVPDDATLEISVMAIEMVYIPGGAFEIGDTPDIIAGNFEAGTTTDPYIIDSEASRTLGGASPLNIGNHDADGMLVPDDFNATTVKVLPAAFPKGFDPFYIMKYEISQGQYVSFLNKIGLTAAGERASNVNANGMNIMDNGDAPLYYETSTPDAACNYLSWADLAAYADWAGLRPLTELEFEKACRGPIEAVTGEYAWGDPFVTVKQYIYDLQGTPDEVIQNPAEGSGNAIYAITDGGNNAARRNGIVAASFVNPTRREAGATYYGVMEMSGSLSEMLIAVGHPRGRDFTGIHGDGVITTNGSANVGEMWPDVFGQQESDGTGQRGGSFNSSVNSIKVSNRILAATRVLSRQSGIGGRLGRSF